MMHSKTAVVLDDDQGWAREYWNNYEKLMRNLFKRGFNLFLRARIEQKKFKKKQNHVGILQFQVPTGKYFLSIQSSYFGWL